MRGKILVLLVALSTALTVNASPRAGAVSMLYEGVKQDVDDDIEAKMKSYFGYVPTDEEMDLYFKVVMAECGYTEPDEGVKLVSDVIANRCRSKKFPNTLETVLKQKNQFETVSTGAIYDYELTNRVYDLCMYQIIYGSKDSAILYFTAGYYNRYCTPAYKIGNHYFGY